MRLRAPDLDLQEALGRSVDLVQLRGKTSTPSTNAKPSVSTARLTANCDQKKQPTVWARWPGRWVMSPEAARWKGEW